MAPSVRRRRRVPWTVFLDAGRVGPADRPRESPEVICEVGIVAVLRRTREVALRKGVPGNGPRMRSEECSRPWINESLVHDASRLFL